MARRTKQSQQLELRARTWGGPREGAGRDSLPWRNDAPHRARPEVDPRHPVHVTLRLRDGLPCLRARRAWATIVRAFRDARERCGLAVIHYSVQSNHLHLMLEIDRDASLESLMRSLLTSLARRLNACFGRGGKLFSGRYDANALSTPSRTRRTLAYVLLNRRKHAFEHGEVLPAEWIDPRSTGVTFDGWDRAIDSAFKAYDFGTSPASTWLLVEGWRRHGLIALDEIPGEERGRRRKKERPNQDRAASTNRRASDRSDR